MVFGNLEDPGREYFIQSSSTRPLQVHGNVAARRFDPFFKQSETFLRNDVKADPEVFDWVTSFTLSLENLPESHISPRIAAAVVFAGKAVKLLQSCGALDSFASHATDVYKYLSAGSDDLCSQYDESRLEEKRDLGRRDGVSLQDSNSEVMGLASARSKGPSTLV